MTKNKQINPCQLFGLELAIWQICRGEERMPLKKLQELRAVLNKGKKSNWAIYCATTSNRNQCSAKNCTIYKICKIKICQKEAKE